MRTQLSNGKTRLYGGATAVRAESTDSFDRARYGLLFSIDPSNTTGWTIASGQVTEIVDEIGNEIPVSGTGLPVSGGVITGESFDTIDLGLSVPAIPVQIGPVCFAIVNRPITLTDSSKIVYLSTGHWVRLDADGVRIGQYYGNIDPAIEFAIGLTAGTKYGFIVQRSSFGAEWEGHKWDGTTWQASTNTITMSDDISFVDGVVELLLNDQLFLLDAYAKYFQGDALAKLKAMIETV